MPAIDIARLKTQAAVLVEKFDQPAVFIVELEKILDLYADRTLRTTIAAPASVLPAYRAPQAVLRQIEMELNPLAASFPEQTLALTAALWQAGYIETRLLAAALLGKTHPETPGLVERINNWVGHSRDKRVRTALLNLSLIRLRRENPNHFLELINTWLNPAKPKLWEYAIYALIPLLEDPAYDNLPPIYSLLTPIIQNAPSSLQNELVEMISALYRASPIETTYFLRQSIAGSTSPQTAIVIRRMIPALPAPLQPAVLEMVRQKTSP